MPPLIVSRDQWLVREEESKREAVIERQESEGLREWLRQTREIDIFVRGERKLNK